MTIDKNLDAIEARLYASEPGPWEWEASAAGVVVREAGEGRRFVLRIVAGAAAVVDLVAHAWGDLRYLVACVRALESQLANERMRHARTAERGAVWAQKAHERSVALEAARALQHYYVERAYAMQPEEVSLWMAFGEADRVARGEDQP